MTITVLLADDHEGMRQSLRAVLNKQKGIAIAGETNSGLEAVRQAGTLAPDVLLVDLMLPDMSGLDVVRRVKHHSPRTRVLLMSMHASEGFVVEGLRAGACGFVLKDCSAAHFGEAVRAAAAGQQYLSPPFSETALQRYQTQTQGAPLELHETLTSAERHWLTLAARGEGTASIAAALAIDPRAAEKMRATVMRKLKLKTEEELASFAAERGWLAG